MNEEVEKYNIYMMELRMEKVEKLIREAEDWNPEKDDIDKLILILEESVSILCKINNRTLYIPYTRQVDIQF